MAAVYILCSSSLKKYYIGSCVDVAERLHQHVVNIFPKAFTSKVKDRVVYFSLPDLTYKQARRIEFHIKSMRSKKYIENLKRYPDIPQIN